MRYLTVSGLRCPGFINIGLTGLLLSVGLYVLQDSVRILLLSRLNSFVKVSHPLFLRGIFIVMIPPAAYRGLLM
jgi:hypothetical protein